MKKLILAATVAAASLAPAANAAVIVTSTPITVFAPAYTGPTPTYDFEVPGAPVTGGVVTNITTSYLTPPRGTAGGNYLAVGPTVGSTSATLSLAGFGPIGDLSFLWSSVDAFNIVELLDSAGTVLFTYTGATLQSALPSGAFRLVKFQITDAPTQLAVSGGGLAGLRISSSRDSFEIDKVAIHAVPETSTWMLMLLGFGALGYAMRQRKVSVRFA